VVALRVGLVGAGPWATMFHAPMVASNVNADLVAVWARRPEAAQKLASMHGAKAVSSYEALLDECDAVVYAVPPDVQALLVPAAARAGKALLLEKPLGLDLAQAQAVADAVQSAGVVNQLMLTNRYVDDVRAFLAKSATRKPIGAVASFISGSCLAGAPFATPWRVQMGAILDLGPHVLDLIDAAVGPIAEISAAGDPRRWVALTVKHENGAISQAALSLNTPKVGAVAGLRVFTEDGDIAVEFMAGEPDPDTPRTILNEFVAAVQAGKPHELDVVRGLYLQQLLDRATRSLNA
jgi:predicted dehydrogenase